MMTYKWIEFQSNKRRLRLNKGKTIEMKSLHAPMCSVRDREEKKLFEKDRLTLRFVASATDTINKVSFITGNIKLS